MAFVNITSFTFQKQSNGKARVDVKFTLTHSPAEKENKISTRVWLRLMDREGARDSFHLNQSWNGLVTQTPAGGRDQSPPGTGWMLVGTFEPNQVNGSFSKDNLDQALLNVDPLGAEEWYVVAISRPELFSNVAISQPITLAFP